MLGKLIKYEMKAMGRLFLPLYGALILLSAINRLFGALKLMIPMAIGATVYSILMGGICVVTLVFTLQRFRRNLLGNEGYLMFTLPVSTDSLILSKLFAAFIWGILSMLSLFISVLIMSATKFDLYTAIKALGELMARINLSNLDFTLLIIEVIIAVIIYLLSTIMSFYACISLSLLVNKRRGLFSFGSFIVISIILQIIGSAVFRAYMNLRPENISTSTAHTFLILCILCGIVTFFVFYFITKFMLSRKLNIE